jgi:hypothetical protein
MKIIVKILQGAECSLDLLEDNTTEDLKAGVARELNIPAENQKLVLKGKTLQDGISLREHKLRDGDKVFLVVKPGSVSVAPAPDSSRTRLDAELRKLLKDSCRSEEECGKIVSAFNRILERRIASLSLDDIERLCEHWRKEKTLRF